MTDPRPEPPAPGEPVAAYRHVPYDIDLEQALLGSLFLDNANIDRAAELIDASAFYDPLHGRLFDMAMLLRTEDTAVTPLTLHSVMKHDPGVIETGGQAYFDALRAATPALPNVRDFCNIIKDLAARRAVIRIAEDMANAAYEGPHEFSTASISEKAADALGEVLAGTKQGQRRKAVSAADAADQLTKKIEEQATAQTPFGTKTGIKLLDDLLGGVYPGKLMVGAGRPGMGKSILGTNIGKNVATRPLGVLGEAEGGRDQGIPVDYLSGELDNDELAARTVCDIEYDSAIRERLKPLEYGDFMQLRPDLPNFNRFILAKADIPPGLTFIDVDGLTLEWIEATCRRRSRIHPGHRLVIIDHLQLVDWLGASRGAHRVAIQTEITKRLKALAKELGITILLLSQLNRDLEKRDDKHPQISDLREGGSIEQDADVIILLYRPIVYADAAIKAARNSEQRHEAIMAYDAAKGVLEIAVPKNRGGKTADFKACFIEPGASAIRDYPIADEGTEELKF